MGIYYANILHLILISLIVMILWTVMQLFFQDQDWFHAFSGALTLAALYGIALFSVLGRTPSENHRLVFSVIHEGDFARELFMNALLYLPLGLALSVLAGPWVIPFALLLSLSIEGWQYFAGTGLAQGTDVIMNTLGAAIGFLSWLAAALIVRHRRTGIR